MDPEQLKALAAQLVTAVIPAVTENVRKALQADAQGARAASPIAAIEAAGGAVAEPAHNVQVGNPVVKGTGLGLIRWAKAMAVAKMQGTSPDEVAKGWGYADLARKMVDHRKALSQGVFSAGGSTVHLEYATEFIELLRNSATFRKAGPRSLPMGAAIAIDRQTGAGTAYYGQEAVDITDSSQTTDQLLLAEKKLTGLTVVNNDLIRNSSISAEEFVRDDLLQVIGLAEDLAFLRGAGSSLAPKGIRYQMLAANAYGETCSSKNAPTYAEVKKEIQKAITTLRKANTPMLRPTWFMTPGVEAQIMNVAGPGGDGTNSFEREMVESHTIRGFPYFTTNQIPGNVSATNRTEIYLVDMSEVILGESMALELEVFPNGAYYNGSVVVAGISRDQTVLRAIEKHDIGLRHTTSAVCIKDSSWDGGS